MERLCDYFIRRKLYSGDVEIGYHKLPRDGFETLSYEGRRKKNVEWTKPRPHLLHSPVYFSETLDQLTGCQFPVNARIKLSVEKKSELRKIYSAETKSDSRQRVSIPHGRVFHRKMASVFPFSHY